MVQAVDHEVIIVGAGIGGMGAAIQLRRMGIASIRIIDRASDLGGTWHLNTYPGIAVDIASVTYSYSFEPNPYWQRLYARGSELKAYAEHVASKYDLRPHMQFNSDVERVVYDEGNGVWTVHVAGQSAIRSRILILATGFLSQPKLPDIPGLSDFKGKVIHTARWDHEYDLTGKRGAVIGTGATAVQLVPRIARKLGALQVYQRTPIWVSPKLDAKISERMQRTFATIPATQRLARATSSSILEMVMVAGALHHRELPFLTQSMERVCRGHMARQIPDRELRRKLTPRYSFGCKRPTFSNDYFPTFMRPNVELITEGIDHIEADAIVSKDGRRRELDVLLLATGYKVWEKGNFPAFEVVGRHGLELGKSWSDGGYESYEGITIAGFPNLFNMSSPYAFTGLSYFFTVEAHMQHIERCITAMRRSGARTFEVRHEAQQAFVKRMKANMGSSVFLHGNCAPANSYYFNPHGESTLLRPEPTPLARWHSAHFPLRDYRFA